MTSKHPTRITQRRVAELAGVSQATVSLVLNNRELDSGRIAQATRDRVLDVIRETTYVADPAARRLAGVDNKILGVFTYEAAFPSERADFYAPLLTGIEAEAERFGCDLLVFTSAPVHQGRRRLFHENNRIGLADGCILVGLEMDADDLNRLATGSLPFVAVGRRDVDGVPYVGIDYGPALTKLVARAIDLGHRRFFYLSLPSDGESVRDRRAGFAAELANTPDAESVTQAFAVTDMDAAWDAISAYRPSVVFVESDTQSKPLWERASAAGVAVPADLSIVVLGDAFRGDAAGVDFARLIPPREDLGSGAVRMLAEIIAAGERPALEKLRVLLDCGIDFGATLGPPAVEAWK